MLKNIVFCFVTDQRVNTQQGLRRVSDNVCSLVSLTKEAKEQNVDKIELNRKISKLNFTNAASVYVTLTYIYLAW